MYAYIFTISFFLFSVPCEKEAFDSQEAQLEYAIKNLFQRLHTFSIGRNHMGWLSSVGLDAILKLVAENDAQLLVMCALCGLLPGKRAFQCQILTSYFSRGNLRRFGTFCLLSGQEHGVFFFHDPFLR